MGNAGCGCSAHFLDAANLAGVLEYYGVSWFRTFSTSVPGCFLGTRAFKYNQPLKSRDLSILVIEIVCHSCSMATFERANDRGASAVFNNLYALDLEPVDPAMVELPQSRSVSPADPLHDSRTARRETVNGQTGMFFEYHYPEIVVPNYSLTEGPVSIQNPTSNLEQEDNSNTFIPRPFVINGRSGLFYPDIYLPQNIELPDSPTDNFQSIDHLQPEENGITYGNSASPTCPAPETAFQLDSLHPAIGGDCGSDPESIPEPGSDNNDDFLPNCQGGTAPQSSVDPDTVLSEPSQVDFVQPHATVEEDESDTVSETDTEPACGYACGIQVKSKVSQDSIRPHATAKSVESGTYHELDTYSESDTYPESDTEATRGHKHDIAQLDLILKRWIADPSSNSQPLIARMFYKLPFTDNMDLCSYRPEIWLDLRTTFEEKMQFDSKADMLFIDDVGAARPSHFNQILEERVSALAHARAGFALPSDEVPWVYKIGIIFVNLTDPKAFMTYVRHSNPYIGMGVPYARKSPKDLHLIPSWQGDFMDLHLDHDRTLLALIRGKHVTQINAIRFTEEAPKPVPGTLQETDLLFVPPKDWAGGATRESLKLKELSLQVSCVPVGGNNHGGSSTQTAVGEQAYFLNNWNCKAFVEAWSEPGRGESVVVKKLRLAQALLG
ncbi:hypothetical protein EV426DRAFT_668017 [Tirmania nivea]|nr:hypothetical protein EV426DRAFT_668017 [Tirmania nivea]